LDSKPKCLLFLFMNPPTSPAIEFLKNRAVDYHLFIHPGPISSLEQAARERGQAAGQVIRSILFRLRENEFFMVLVSGPRQVNWRQLRLHFNTNRLTLATPEEVLSVTGYRIGTVSPFGFSLNSPILVDQRVKNHAEISLGSGLPGIALIIRTDDLIRLIEPMEWIDI
jgi:Cys-tRNA(Pro)/Cys-tRNA(Cys) deacylase